MGYPAHAALRDFRSRGLCGEARAANRAGARALLNAGMESLIQRITITTP